MNNRYYRIIKENCSAWLNRFLKGTMNHFSCVLPDKMGFLPQGLLRIFFRGIRFSPDQEKLLKSLPDDAILIYVNKYKNPFEWLFCYSRFTQQNLRPPVMGVEYQARIWQPVIQMCRIVVANLYHVLRHFKTPDIYSTGFFQEKLVSGSAAWLSLADDKGFYRRFVKEKTDPIQHIIQVQRSTDRPVIIVPVLMFYSNMPDKSNPGVLDIIFGTENNPGLLRRYMAMLRKPGKFFLEISEPLVLNQFLDVPENSGKTDGTLALQLRRQMLFQINRHRVSTTGPARKTPEELKQDILTREPLRNYMEHYAKSRNLPIYKVHKQADEYIKEIAARYNPALINMASKVVGWITNSMFDGVSMDHDGLNRLKILSQKGPLILIPCHKSHIDYLILSYILHHNDMPCPHIAAGKNLSFWPVGSIFRGGGAFFIRRTFRGAALYVKVFSEYVHKLLEEGFNIEFFIEGGRSRTGKLILPKLGLLSILMDAYRNGASRDLTFVPIYIGYDRVLEESSYLHELEGGQKKPENFWQVIKARKVLKKRYGRIYIRFNEAISLNQVLAGQGVALKDMTSKQNNELCRNLGFRIINSIDAVSVITPHALVAGALLNMAKKRFSSGELMDDIEIYLNYLASQNAKLADTLLIDPSHAVCQVLDSYVNRNFIERYDENSENTFSCLEYMIIVNKRPILEYYKNNCIVFFVPAVFTAMTILEKDAFQFQAADIHPGYAFLRHFFKNEFAYDVEKTPEYHVRKTLKAFIDDAIIMPHPTLPDTYRVTSAGFRKLRLFARFLKTYFESYWVALNFFMRYPQNAVDSSARSKKIQSRGARMYKRREIEHKEALSIINFKNAEDFFVTNGVTGSEDKEKIEFYALAIQKYLNILSA
ncbi:MAG: 1-acyl-sn-glycerol-3-phosphate acyltransferase [Desulfatirhabdiaceae bacterium]